MQIDVYRSNTTPAYSLVVPVGTDLVGFDGEVGVALSRLRPLVKVKTGELESIFSGDLLAFLQSQIAEKGAGLVKTEVRFSELSA